jgi:diguanylate cyclase (GGDEF)-like protein
MQSLSKRLLAVATFVAVVSTVLTMVAVLGQYTFQRLLSRNAVASAEVWFRAVTRNSESALQDLVRHADSEKIQWALETASIDAIVVVSRDGGLRALGKTTEDAVQNFRTVLRDADEGGPDSVLATEPGAYSTDHLGFTGVDRYRSWVLFPTAPGSGERLGLRVEQTATAKGLVESFWREIFYSGGVAGITFASFMAGFTYRTRQLAAENQEIRYVALHDGLTGMPNRKQFEEFLTTALAGAATGLHKSALFVLDLDGFKSVNDTLGHPVGDGLLKAAARRLKGSLRGDDLLARLSGDEFAIVVPRITDPSMLAPMADRVVKLLSTPFRVEGHEIQIGCSIGVAVAPDNGADIDRLIRNADFALYRAKSEGRRTWRFFDPKMAEDQASRRSLEDGLRHALENDLFHVYYQPQIDLASGKTVGYEAVLRWMLPGKGLVPASVFVSIAEESGLVVPIGEWVIRQVARDCALLPADCHVAINLSATQLKRDGIEVYILETLRSHGVAAGRMEIEVNESIMGRNEEIAFERLARIREGGLSIVMESFGLGSMNLGLLSRYTFDKIKVDGSFLMQDQQRGGAVLAAICSLGRSLGFRVAGQGVETREHVQMLRAAGCSEAQGFYFAAPMPLNEILERVAGGAGLPLAATA